MRRFLTSLFLLVTILAYGQLSFEEKATALGAGVTYGASYLGGGISFCDFDGDGWDDLTFATTDLKEIYFFKNNAGTFEQVDLGINDTYETKQVLWVDYDNDGDKDFFATSIFGPNKFYRNDGNLSFTDITGSSGLFTDNLYTYGACFGDIDNDGDLDVHIVNLDDFTYNQRNYLYENDNGTFVDITAQAGLYLGNDLSFCSSFFDYNNDGYLDLYISNDRYLKKNRLYRNNKDGTFEEVSDESGAGMAINAMSTTIGDYNNDGWPDIYVTNTSQGNYHLRNNGNGTFTNVAASVGTAFYSIAWGAVFLDADNDTDLDLYVSGMLDGSDGRIPSAFYENTNGSFTIPSSIGFDDDNRASFANAIGDINNDGLPDIVVMNDTQNNFLWQNNTSTANKWLKIKLQGTQSNIDGIGSKIEVHANGKSQYRYALCGEGYLSQNSGAEFFGLANATTIDYVKVTWLSGTVDIIYNVATNQTLDIMEGQNALSTTEDLFRNLAIYPNPSNGKFNLTGFNSDQENVTLEVFNSIGVKVKTEELVSATEQLDITELQRGVYYLKFTSDSGFELKKVIYN